jgi:hypothetical protein
MALREFFDFALFPFFVFLAHATLCRLPHIKKLPRQTVAILAPVVPTIGMLLALQGDWGKDLFVLFVCVAQAHIYFHVFNMSETARRIRILVGIQEEGRMPLDSQTAQNAILIRLQRLKDLKQVRHAQPGDYSSAPSLLTFVAVGMTWYERLLFPDKSY